MGIQPHVFKWNGLYDTIDTGKDVVGIIANELQKIVPEAIYSLKGKLHKDDTEEIDILHYDLTPIVMVHNNAINELVVTLNDLSARVKRLENER